MVLGENFSTVRRARLKKKKNRLPKLLQRSCLQQGQKCPPKTFRLRISGLTRTTEASYQHPAGSKSLSDPSWHRPDPCPPGFKVTAVATIEFDHAWLEVVLREDRQQGQELPQPPSRTRAFPWLLFHEWLPAGQPTQVTLMPEGDAEVP